MTYDVVVIGGGPAGLAAAVSADKEGAKVLIIEREARLGGILKQCIHDGFGLITFKEKLSGPEYAERFIDMVLERNIETKLLTFVTKIEKNEALFTIYFVNREGASHIETKSIVLATGCRERTAKQIFIQGTRPSGVFTAGSAQNFVNLMGELPTKKCVILGSGDIGLIMARRLTLEGAKVEGVYEVKPTPSGLTRNIHQCLLDFNIPLYLSHTVTRIFGNERLEAVEVAEVDEKLQPKVGTEKIIECDSLILSVGLIPENELAESIGVSINGRTKGPVCDQLYMTSIDGVYSAGNALHVNDLVDYVTENALEAGKNSSKYIKSARKNININIGREFLYTVPTVLNLNAKLNDTTIYFRAGTDMFNVDFLIKVDGKQVFSKKYTALRPPEMERLKINFDEYNLNEKSKIEYFLEAQK
ncbi:MAG: FAD-dependent oxidoreductase [Clostridia bacterium]